MPPIKEIAERLYPVCLDVEQKIVGQNEQQAIEWAHSNAARHARTVCAILERRLKGPLFILNASGLSCGHQDFAIAGYLKDAGVQYRWVSCESPQSPYLENQVFRRYVENLGIELLLSDFSSDKELYGQNIGYDVVLFTEIAEHLDHSTFLAALGELRRKVADDGMMIVTTPNLLCLLNRIRFLLGNADAGIFWGDGQANLEKGLFGHIVAYDRRRMVRLLTDAGFAVEKSFTFNSAYRKIKSSIFHNSIMSVIDFISQFIPDSSSTLFVQASPGKTCPVLFQI